MLVLACGCGKKGPPLPPIVRVPAAPADFAAERRADEVVVTFRAPSANTDGTRPANIHRIDVYALTNPTMVPVDELVARGRPIASVEVKGPRDPDDVIEPDEPAENMEPLDGPGLDQGVTVAVAEALADGTVDRQPGDSLLRIYVGVGVSRNGRRGLISSAAAVPLGDAPPAPPAPRIAYDEAAITVTWPGTATPGITYHVYEIGGTTAVAPGTDPPATPAPVTRLTGTAIAEPKYQDERIAWGVERCYAVRAVATVDEYAVQSASSPPACVTLVDTFPPAPPSGLQTAPSQAAISLVWDANKEKDLAGYVVLRGDPSGDTLAAITPAPIQETSFTDAVMSGTRYVYAIRAVDKAGNASAISDRREETAR